MGDRSRLQLGFVTLCIASSTRNWVGSSSVCGFLDSLALTTHSLLKAQNRREWTMPSTTRGGSSDWFCSGLPCTGTSSKKTMWPWLSWRYVCVWGGGGVSFILRIFSCLVTQGYTANTIEMLGLPAPDFVNMFAAREVL